MSTTSLLILAAAVLLTAALSSALTLLIARRVVRRRYRDEVDRLLERLGDVVEERVRKGVVEGITSLPTQDLLRRTREAVGDAAGELVRGGLGALLGDGPPKK